MQKLVIYKYLGTNGVIESPVHLEDIYYIRLIEMMADAGKILVNTKTNQRQYQVRVPEEEADNWKEIPEGQE